MDLDDHSIVGGQGVGQGVGVMGESPRIEDDGRRSAPGAVDGVDQGALVVRLEVLDVVTVLRGGFTRVSDAVVEGVGAVDVRLARAEQIQVRS